MDCDSNLVLHQRELPASSEWTAASEGWGIVRLRAGDCYCLDLHPPAVLAVGEVVVVPPGRSACFRASQLGAARLDYFFFQPGLMGGLLTLSERHELAQLAAGERAEIHRVGAAEPLALEYAALCESARGRGHFLERCRLMMLAAGILSPGAARTGDAPFPGGPARLERLAISLPEAEIARRTPQELASLCGCSLRHFTRLFRIQFGVSIGEKLKQLRLEKARHLVSETDATLEEIARQSGYRSRVSFLRCFKQRFGVAPAEMRRRAQAAPVKNGR